MKCYHHPEAEALSECRICGHPLCGACAVELKGAPYCRECLQSRLETPSPPPPARPPEFRSAKAAGWLAVVPGLGLVYLGQYLSALTVALLFVGAIHMADHSDMGGLFVTLIWVGQIIYTVREARRTSLLDERREGWDSPLWGG